MSFEAASNPFVLDAKDQTTENPRSGDWDARLAVARAKRAKVLAEQAAKPKTNGVKKPPFLLDNVDLKAETAAFLSDAPTPVEPKAELVDAIAQVAFANEAPAFEPPVVNTPSAIRAPVAPVLLSPEFAVPVNPPTTKPARFNRTGVIVVASFTGLGLGFALGLGLLIGAGWVSPTQFAATATEPVKAPAKTAIAVAPPVAVTTGPATAAVADSGPVVASIAPVEQMLPSAMPQSGAAQTQWIEDLTIAPHSQLPTQVAADADLNLARFQTLQTNNPAAALGGYAPAPVTDVDQTAAPVGTSVQYASISPDLPAVPMLESGSAQTAWVNRLTIEPHAKLPTQTEGDAGLSLARFQMLDTNNPAKVLGAYAPSPIPQAARPQALLTLPGSAVQYASAGAIPFDMPTLPQNELAFIAPSLEASLSPYDRTMVPQTALNAAVPLPAWPNAEAAVASYVPRLPVELNFAQSLGLTADQQQAFSLTLLAPDQVDDTAVQAFGVKLGETGLPLARTQKVGFTVSELHIRFYSSDSKPVAVALADTLGIEARDFVSTGRSTTGIEVWMSGTSVEKVAKPQKVSPRVNTTAQVRTQLSNRIINGLRNATRE